MYGSDGSILYVGKAKHLKKRVSSYFARQGLSLKTQSLVSKIAKIEVTLTRSETEALILEQNQIKTLKPPYNILLRDDKSYPYIYLASDKEYPSLSMKRARSKGKVGRYFGPFPSSGSVKESLNMLEKIFKVRQCHDSYYNNRSRPCLQYQIKRCKAPCVGLVSHEEYLEDVKSVEMFLQGKSPELIRRLISQMEQASIELKFEEAAEIRDQIEHLRHVQESQSAEGGTQSLDVVVLVAKGGSVVASMLYVRNGRILGHKNYFPKLSLEMSNNEMLSSFVEQYYIGQNESRDIPGEIVLNESLSNQALITEAIEQVVGKKVKISTKVKQLKAQWLKLASTNAENALQTHLANKENMFHKFDALAELLQLEDRPKRMECFDISHSSGEKTVGSCVVFNEAGPMKSDYRTYNIEGITGGDDYAAMRQTLERRYKALKDNPDKRPDLILIDGGKGQLNLALEVFDRLNLSDLNVIGVAKGVTRKPGFETLLIPEKAGHLKTIDCASDNPGLHLIQQIRDEAHRFAITGHRNRRDKARRQSTLENIEGVGAKRRKALLQYFGSVSNIKKASTEEIAKVSGISTSLAEHIYLTLHSS
ncbi:excinuclease ABC subunit C [Oleiphilus sp. HI0085]|nr:excinuclease ABC subunit C [Oleiphilus sp. HI0043]KZY56624.1 excinuclease ABC subunit C [Oleiphilus sp. HI0061]KZY76147.1 excinuclease ABC subunit C [Oleiphilus sp. HI0069]KZZ33897.1 excinuclease ABC subunit C [Oleiphilus sp. HI0085]KZZ36550.1 excinuclease ABC subunit C [Oleiphilus sp. HI0117]KZZ36618.1 excinuclease ABC subunit C [Oleiphilus sp. HI0086]KZZ68867.1 excinuclease ABC subunit C [Oleiphilus sp. HI0128]KZZ76235.1 excinuclease ABC subunit C [Oleiphilus sp. HI0132]